jgi:hypothetical protein
LKKETTMTHAPRVPLRAVLAGLLAAASLILGLTLAGSPAARAATLACTDATLTGSYTGAVAGTSPAGPFLITGTAGLAGNGTGSGTFTITQGGTSTQVTDVITYALAADCTGTLHVVRSNGTQANYDLAAAPDGSAFAVTATDPGVTAGGAFARHR